MKLVGNPRYSGYQYETSPRKLQPDVSPRRNKPYPKKKTTVKKKVQTNQHTKKKVKEKRKLKKEIKAMLYIAIGFVVLFAMGYQNSLITESFNAKEEAKKELVSIEKENEQLKVSIENGLNLHNVEQSAKEMLGMQKLDNGQKVYVELPKKDYVEPAAEQIIIDIDTPWYQTVLDTIHNWINQIL